MAWFWYIALYVLSVCAAVGVFLAAEDEKAISFEAWSDVIGAAIIWPLLIIGYGFFWLTRKILSRKKADLPQAKVVSK